MCYLKLSLVVTFLNVYLLFSSSSNDSHCIPKAKRGRWYDAMINAVAKTAYRAGNKIMKVLAEWLVESPNGRPTRECAKIQRLKNSTIKFKRSAVKGRIIASFFLSHP